MSEILILNFLYLCFPLTLYIIYNMYASTYQKEINDLLSTFLIGTSFYLLMRFGLQEFKNLPLILISVPLLIAYVIKNRVSIILLSFITLFYYIYLNYSVLLVIICLLLNYLLYYVLYIKKMKKQYFVFSFIGINILMVFVQYCEITSEILWLELAIYLITNVVLSYLVVVLLENSDRMAKLHSTLKDMEHEKDVQLSIFKITHEIKNPIAVCKGYLDMFDISNPEHSTKYIPIIHSEINRTLCLLQDFLELNKIKIEKEEMDLSVLLDELKNSCEPLLKNQKIDYRFNDLEEEIYLQGDFNRLKQVCINMIKNSMESLKNVENPYVSVLYKQKKDYVHIYIEDNGCGMSKEILSKIREPFFTTKNTGTGLGVTISSEVIKAHGGKINYHSRENVGTRVEIILPLN